MNENDTNPDIQVRWREEQTRLLRLVEALVVLDKTKEWTTLKELVFDKSVKAIERQMLNECLAPEVNTDKIYRLQGEYAWAKQYSDIDKFVEMLKKQLEEIKTKLK